MKLGEVFSADRDEIAEIIRVWRRLGIKLDPARVREHLRELEEWARRWKKN